jgi:hypothetical protein
MAPMLEERARNSPVDDVMYQIYPKLSKIIQISSAAIKMKT